MLRLLLLLVALFLGGCGGGGMSLVPGPDPGSSTAMIEGYVRQYVVHSERAEITAVDRKADAGIERTAVSGLTTARVPPGERCVQVEIKSCTSGSCGDPTVCAFSNYFVAGQVVQLKAGSLKLDKPPAGGAIVDATMQAEVSAKGFATLTRRLAVKCGEPLRGVCERGTPPLPRQPIQIQGK